MELNRKVFIAIAILVGASIWGFESIRTRLYSGTELNFGLGSGTVTLTNSSDSPQSVQLVSTRTEIFTVASDDATIAGRSTAIGIGRDRTQRYEFVLPTGVSAFSLVRSPDVRFVSNTDTALEASVQPLSTGDSRATLVVAGIAIVGSLFYLSSANDHRWMSAARRQKAKDQATAQEEDITHFKNMFKPHPSESVQNSQDG